MPPKDESRAEAHSPSTRRREKNRPYCYSPERRRRQIHCVQELDSTTCVASALSRPRSEPMPCLSRWLYVSKAHRRAPNAILPRSSDVLQKKPNARDTLLAFVLATHHVLSARLYVGPDSQTRIHSHAKKTKKHRQIKHGSTW